MVPSMRSSSVIGGLSTVVTTVLIVACGARSSLPVRDGERGEGGSGGESPIEPECAVYESSTALAPLDMFIMLDASGSMSEDTAQGNSKWDAVRAALEDFTSAPDSSGISVALGFFPINIPGIPTTCNLDADCGAPDTCDFFNICTNTFTGCFDDVDCGGVGGTCVPFGQCTTTPAPCTLDGTLPCEGNTGPCQPLGACRNRTDCDLDTYDQPVVDLVGLPGGSDKLIAAIDVRTPDGQTPTLVGLQGAIAQASTQLTIEPDHEVITVLATDGFPTACDDDIFNGDPTQAIPNVAEVAATGAAQGVRTFVIGVFSPEQASIAQDNLDTIAQAGGSEAAYVVSTTDQVTSGFLEALNTVRLNAKACEFDLVGDDVDYETIWLRLTPKDGSDPIWVPRVDGLDDCSLDPGFYFDVPIDQGVPNTVILCPATCNLLGTSTDRTVDIFTTCPDPTDG